MFIFSQRPLTILYLNLLALHLSDVGLTHIVFELLSLLIPDCERIFNFRLFVLNLDFIESVPLRPLLIFLVKTLLRLTQFFLCVALVGLLNMFLLGIGQHNRLPLFSQSVDLLVLRLFKFQKCVFPLLKFSFLILYSLLLDV